MSVTAAASASRGVGLPAPDTSMVPVPYRVVRRNAETHDTVTLALEPVAEPVADAAPGQFHMVWAPAVGEVPVSVAGLGPPAVGAGTSCTSATTATTVELTIRAVGATTSALTSSEAGEVVGLRGPYGRPWTLPAPDEAAVVVAGGLGLAPLRLLATALFDDPSRGARTDLVVGARHPDEVIYAAELAARATDAAVHITVDRPSTGWRGHVGLVTAELARLPLGPATRAAVCGPEIMMRAAARDLVAAGLHTERIEVSLERSMACAVAHCGRCQLGPVMLCRDGPVLTWSEAAPLMEVRRW